MASIQELSLKIKNAAEVAVGEWGLVAVVFLISLASFGLGRLSALEDARPPVSITEAPTSAQPQALALGGLVVASRTGTVYYYPWCAGAQKIAVTKQVWFASESAAQKTGLAPAKSCKGLQ